MPVEITFGKNAKKENVTNFSLQVLEDILQASGLSGALISSTARTPAEQARVMFDNIVSAGVAAPKKLYAAAGDAEIDEFEQAKQAEQNPNEEKAARAEKIIANRPTKVA